MSDLLPKKCQQDILTLWFLVFCSSSVAQPSELPPSPHVWEWKVIAHSQSSSLGNYKLFTSWPAELLVTKYKKISISNQGASLTSQQSHIQMLPSQKIQGWEDCPWNCSFAFPWCVDTSARKWTLELQCWCTRNLFQGGGKRADCIATRQTLCFISKWYRWCSMQGEVQIVYVEHERCELLVLDLWNNVEKPMSIHHNCQRTKENASSV